ncbi:5-carboxymethyl-2-hydroxymuconate semialdehyde dehydrogenase [Psychrobacter immobilis]|uniref:5-carboxymethyl-2-hydroxymuconate semialdehyde dehydrogenase n=1 Tax=Psychrobacter immobilis TaxID=498 RepID=UPI00191A821D|nr:5-carboxymethyl-2-hydroxymuconate semialdehyde dehydrogenase [Psychrobacter immobilis]
MIKHIINGQHVESEDVFESINPATGKVIAEVASGGQKEVDSAVAAAKAAFPAWSTMPAKERSKIMHNVGDLITKHVPELAEMETNDCGQVISQTLKSLIPRSANNFHYFAEIAEHMHGESYDSDTGHLNYTMQKPAGVCALISPWNVPFMTATWKTGPCLALGNTAVMKMSELSPMTVTRLGELMREAGVPDGVFNIVHGFGQQAGEPLVSHPDVRAISFTGSTPTGNRIIRSAGLKKYSMELGGKSPFIIFDDADYERALDAALFMIFSNNGQRCTAGSRIIVQSTIYDKFVADYVDRAAKLTIGDPLNPNTIIGPMISKAHQNKVMSYIEAGQKEGARLVLGGGTPQLDDKFKNGFWVEPTVFADVDNKMSIAQDEIFGPVPCIIPFKTEEEALQIANDTPYGLSSYLWTENTGRVLRLSKAIDAGMTFVNSQNVRDLRQPFGGTKGSGTGREGNHYSFDVFCELKNVAISYGDHRIPRWGV